MSNNKKKNREAGGNPGNLTGEGSGQQTSGQRQGKMSKSTKAGYHRSSAEKGQPGRHGGNH
jgi:hypothetical protein